MALSFFDCNTFAGPVRVNRPGSDSSFEALAENMARYGIDKALVYYTLSVEQDTQNKNEELPEIVKGTPQLFPVWAVLPHHTGEFCTPDILIENMKQADVRMLRLFHMEHGLSVADVVCGELFKTLNDHRVPLILSKEGLPFESLFHMCKTYPNMPVILTEVGYRNNRTLYPIMEKVQNLHLETGGLLAHNAIEELSARFGVDKLIFGSGMPIFSGGAAVAKVSYARLSESEKLQIASGNLERLLGGVLW